MEALKIYNNKLHEILEAFKCPMHRPLEMHRFNDLTDQTWIYDMHGKNCHELNAFNVNKRYCFTLRKGKHEIYETNEYLMYVNRYSTWGNAYHTYTIFDKRKSIAPGGDQ